MRDDALTQALGFFACHESRKCPYLRPNERSFIATPQRYWPALVIAAAVAAAEIAVITAAHAQTVNPDAEGSTAASNGAVQTADVERVIVTGSHIPTAAEVGPNPVQELDRDYIEKAPERTAEQLLRDLPVANANGVPLSNNGTGSAPGASSISLRGFDPSATLVLIDGRRVAPYPVGAGGTQTFVDLNTIARAAIESIEILKDGASTTYGADAVAGVVNVKFRQDYRGAETQLEYGNTLDKDNGEFAASVVFGAGDDTIAVTGVLNYYHRNDIFNRDRGFSNFADPGQKSTASNPGQFQLTQAAVIAAGVPPEQLPDASTFFGRPPNGTNGLTPASDYLYYPSRQNLFNFNAFASSFPKAERYGGFVNFHDKICGDQLVAYGDFFQETARNRYELAPTTVTFQSIGLIPVAIPPHAAGATLGGPTYADTGLPLGAFNPFNPFQQIISGRSRYRLVDFPNRIIDDESNAYMSTIGLKGDKLFDGSWGYDAGFRYSEVTDAATGNEVSRSRFNRILNAADPIFDPNSAEFIGTTVPYNPFGDYHKPIPTNAPAVGFATVHPKDLQSSKLTTLDLNIYTTSLFKLPAGSVGLAFGGQFRRENITQDPDDLNLSGDILGTFGPETTTVAGRKSFGIYAETLIPIVSPEMGVPAFHLVEFTASARFEDFLNNDTNILVPKVGLRWQPFDDSLTLRATWGEGFREPSLFELFNSPALFFSSVFDRRNPGKPAKVNNVDIVLTSNPNLQPEDSRNFNAGVVYTPKFVPDLTASVDYFVIERHDVVGVPNPQDILNREGHLFPGEAVIRDPEGFLTEIIGPYENNGGERATGFDFTLQYQLHTSFGTWTTLNQATCLDSFRLAISRVAPALEVRSQSTGGLGEDAWLKWKGRSRLDWSWKGFTLSTTAIYTDGYHEILNTTAGTGIPFPDGKHEHWVKQTWIFDGQLSYNFTFSAPVQAQPVPGYSIDAKQGSGKNVEDLAATSAAAFALPCWKMLLNNTRITLGCNNIFGQDPPRTFFSPQNYPGSIYDSVGRFVYASVTKKF